MISNARFRGVNLSSNVHFRGAQSHLDSWFESVTHGFLIKFTFDVFFGVKIHLIQLEIHFMDDMIILVD